LTLPQSLRNSHLNLVPF